MHAHAHTPGNLHITQIRREQTSLNCFFVCFINVHVSIIRLHDTSDEGLFEFETGLFGFSWLLQTLSMLYIQCITNSWKEDFKQLRILSLDNIKYMHINC